MFNVIVSGRTAGARLKERVAENGDKINQLTFSLYTKNKDKSEWVTCTLGGKFAETIAPWLMIEREDKEEGKDKYVSRLVTITGRMSITREEVGVPFSVVDTNDEVLFEGETSHMNTNVVLYVDRVEFLDSNPEKDNKGLGKTSAADLDDDLKERMRKLKEQRDKAKAEAQEQA